MDWEICLFLLITPVPFIIGLVGTLLGLTVRPFQTDLSKRIIRGSWLLTGTLTLSACAFTILWSYFVFGNLYEHWDYIPLVDCSPFWLNPQYGTTYYHGMTKHLIFALWGFYALLCWGSAVGMTWWFMNHKRIRPRTSNFIVQ